MISKKGKVWYDTEAVAKMVQVSGTTRERFIEKLDLLWQILSPEDKKQYNKNIASRVLQEYLCKEDNHKSTGVLET